MLPNMVYASMCLLLLFSPAFGRRWVQQPDTPNSEEETDAPKLSAVVSNNDAETPNVYNSVDSLAEVDSEILPTVTGRWVFLRQVFGSADQFNYSYGGSISSGSARSEAQSSLDTALRSRSTQFCFFACSQSSTTTFRAQAQSRFQGSFTSKSLNFSTSSSRVFNENNGPNLYQFQWDVKVGSRTVAVLKEEQFAQGGFSLPRCLPGQQANRNYSICKDDYYQRFNRTDLDGSPQYGDRFIQIGRWFMAELDRIHFSIANIDTRKTALIFRDDGTLHNGPRNDFQAFNRRFGEPTGIQFGENFIQIGQWRLADFGKHFSIAAARTNKTALILRDDGNVFPGPRNDFQSFSRPSGERKGVESGERFIQIGNWRFADIDGEHFSVAADRSRKTAEIFLADGTIQRGPRNDFQAFSRKAVQ